MRSYYLLFVLLVALASVGPAAQAQVVVAPTFLVIDATRPLGTFNVINRGASVQEVEISFRFGYPVSDSTGTWTMTYEAEGEAAGRSAESWVRAFPRRLVLEPGARQAIRVMVQPPSGLADGVYWTRLVVSSKEQAPLAAAAVDAISAKVNVILEHSVPLVVQRGAPTTALRLGEGTALVADGTIQLTVPVVRIGDAPYFGTLDVRVLDDRGTEVYTFDRGAAVYFDFTERVEMQAAGWAPGRYRAQLTFRGGRDSVAAGLLPTLNPVSTEIAFVVPLAEAPAGDAGPALMEGGR